MSNTQRPKALAKLAPPWPSKTHHLTPAEARDVYQYVVALEEALEGYRMAFRDALKLRNEGAQP